MKNHREPKLGESRKFKTKIEKKHIYIIFSPRER